MDLKLKHGTQDLMSIQIEVMLDLKNGNLPKTFHIVDKDEIKEFNYAQEGTASLRTAIGQLDTVIVSSQRTGNDRILRMWFAPSLGFLPIQAERWRDGKLEFAMRIKSITGRLSEPSVGSGLRQGNSALSLVFSTAIPVGGLANLVGFEKQHLRDALVGIDLCGQRRRVGKFQRDMPFPLRLERSYIDYDAAIVHENTRLQSEIAGFGNRQAVHILVTGSLPHGHNFVIAIGWGTSELRDDFGKTPENRAVAFQQIGRSSPMRLARWRLKDFCGPPRAAYVFVRTDRLARTPSPCAIGDEKNVRAS